MPSTYITSRGYRLTDDADELTDDLEFNLWARNLWPFRELKDGDTLYWYDATQKTIVWKSRATHVRQFQYATRQEVIDRIDDEYDVDITGNSYLEERPTSGYCVVYKVKDAEPVNIPKPADDFNQLGWMRPEDDPDGHWFGLLEQPNDGKPRIIFMRIAWMTHYEGITSSDKPKGGGKWVEQHGFGHEIYNFQEYRGSYYGFVQASGKGTHGTINLERVSEGATGDSLSGVTVVWVATHPAKGAVIVGWFKNATIYRKVQPPPPGSNRTYGGETFGYYATCDATDGTLLKRDDRTFSVPQRVKGFLGQKNVWYADDPDLNTKFRADVLKYIETGDREDPPVAVVAEPATGSPRQPDPLLRARVEKAAVEVVTKFYKDKKYKIVSREPDNVGWDLTATLGTIELMIEVKGLSGTQTVVELTPNEYKAMVKHRDTYRVCIVSNALVDPRLEVFSYSPDSGQWENEDQPGRVLNLLELTGVRCTAVNTSA